MKQFPIKFQLVADRETHDMLKRLAEHYSQSMGSLIRQLIKEAHLKAFGISTNLDKLP